MGRAWVWESREFGKKVCGARMNCGSGKAFVTLHGDEPMQVGVAVDGSWAMKRIQSAGDTWKGLPELILGDQEVGPSHRQAFDARRNCELSRAGRMQRRVARLPSSLPRLPVNEGREIA